MKKNFQEFKDYIKGKETAVVGIGVSNRPVIDFLLKLGAKITAFDKKDEQQLGEVSEALKQKGVKLELGDDYLDKLRGFEVVFKTPSMRIDSDALARVKKEGAYVTSEIEEFVRYCPAKIYGITGSDGKTTTTTIIYNILREEGFKTWVGGNIGTPLFSNIEDMDDSHRVVLELSSFQLMTMKDSPQVAVVTNLSPNHLDMHKGMDEYIQCKKNIFLNQEEKDLLILNRDNVITNNMRLEGKARVKRFSVKERICDGAYIEEENLMIKGEKVCSISEVKIKGMHNVENLLAAFLATYEEVSIESMRKIAITFSGVEHRCEFVRELNGIKFYNDSIASSPTRTVAGLRAFEKPVILIAGGYDKNIPFEPLAKDGISKIKALILMGNTKYKIKASFDKVIEGKKIELPMVMVDSMEEAIIKARELGTHGDIVTLSPACASFDMYTNFEVRGNKFKEIVNSL